MTKPHTLPNGHSYLYIPKESTYIFICVCI